MFKVRRIVISAFAGLFMVSGAAAQEPEAIEDIEAARAFLVEQVVAHTQATAQVTGRPAIDGSILDAIGTIPRHEFVASEAAPLAYFDLPLPADHDLRESQPFIVAMMTDLVAPASEGDLLILGIGGGYHAAVASGLVDTVYLLDLDATATASGMERLDRLGYENIEARVADPYFGWPDTSRRFDSIIIRLAVDSVPSVLLRQLKPGGRLVAPVGRSDEGQQLTLFTKDADGEISQEAVMPVRFMRLPGGERI
ncbi:MAG: protein-L-isoaspartate O-methyltransferase family protein [Rhizobiaceae bacterium]